MTQCIPTKDGIPFTPWIHFVFGNCTYGFLDGASVLLGYLSILFWLNAQFPQVIENYRRGSAEGLSINFLTIWLAGDTANLIGCILTNQLAFQRYLGMYFVTVDICLLSQYLYYCKWQRRGRPSNINSNYYRKTQYDSSKAANLFSAAFQHPSVQTPLLIQTQSVEDEITPYSVSSSPSKWYTLTQHDGGLYKTPSTFSSTSTTTSTSSSSSTKTKSATTGLMAVMLLGLNLYSPSNLTTTTTAAASNTPSSIISLSDLVDPVILGSLFAWSCTTLYLMSRIPQIRKNLKRRSVDGLSPSLFIFAVCGNLTYATSILLHPGQTRETLLDALPYLIGSAGTLTFDFTIFVQFIYYTRRKHRLANSSNLVTV